MFSENTCNSCRETDNVVLPGQWRLSLQGRVKITNQLESMVEGYVYKIIFSDGCWYWGTSQYKGAAPEKDGYYGSPVTHKEKWREPFSQIIVKEFYSEQERLDYETMCILPDLDNPKCLNEHAVRSFSKDICSKAGKKSAEKLRGIPRTEEVKAKISAALKGRKLSPEHVQKLKQAERPPITAENIAKRVESRKGYRHSEETKQKISQSNKGKIRTLENRQKTAESVKGFKWYNDGENNIQARSHPGEGWVEGRILGWESSRNTGMKWYHRNGERRMFRGNPGEGWVLGMPKPKGKRYYNNGTDHVLAFECPGEGWVPGRLSRK